MTATIKPRPRPISNSFIPTDLSDVVSTPKKLPSRIAIHAPEEWIEFIQLLEELRMKKQMAIILLFHTQVVKFANPEGADYDRYQPAINPATWGETHKWCDMILFGAFETFVQMQNKSAPKGKG